MGLGCGVIALLLIGIGLWVNRSNPGRSQAQPTALPASPTRTPTTETIAALARLEPQGEVIQLSASAATAGSRVDQLTVKLGDRVQPGQIIAVLDNRDRLAAALAQARSQYQVAQARLAQVKAGAKQGQIQAQKATLNRLTAELQGQVVAQTASIARLQAQFNNARTECQRYQLLFNNGAIAASQRDNICLQPMTLQDQLREARANRDRTVATLNQQRKEAEGTLQQIAEIRPVDIAIAQAEVQASQAAIQQAEANLALAYVRSPQQGQILKIQIRPGEIIGNQGIVEIGNTDQMIAIAEVYETDIDKVKLGDRATLTGTNLQEKFTGTVSEIGLQIGKKDILGTDPAADVDARVVEVKIRLDPASSQRLKGLTNLLLSAIIQPSSP